MKFSATDWSFAPHASDPERFYADLAAHGFEGIEMVADEARRSQARAAGLQVLNLAGPGMQQGVNRREHHASLLPALTDRIALAAEEGIPQVIVFSGNRQGQPDEEGIAHCRRAFEQLLPEAEQAGVTLVFEMLNSFNHVDYQADRSSFGFQLAEQLNHPRFRILYDLYHLQRMGEACAVEVCANLGKIAHLHVAEAPDRGMPRADGNIPYRAIVPEILGAGYDGFWGFEFLPTEGNSLTELIEAKDSFLRLAG